eukprot:TRINITY_DN3811_c0_g3_i2.p1 TRINITY_DN3811_c0_g3~~TRINITY_DN3811_c0_g3_i2.p1  ORF type:complete len:105 (-),score=18.59 TRINITY_DN3811_c0_g3_i2:212-526(-)
MISLFFQARFIRRHFAPEVKDSSFPPLSQRNLESDLFMSCCASTGIVSLFWISILFIQGFDILVLWVLSPLATILLVYYGHNSLQDLEKGIMQLQMSTYRCKKA